MIKRLKNKKILIAALVLSIICCMPAVFADMSDPQTTPPDTAKTLTYNGDGTYKLSLSVTGKAGNSMESNKADVIIILDTSGSMNYYVESTTGRYGGKDGDYHSLYKESREVLKDDTYTGTVYYWTGSRYSEYTGTRYEITKRIDVAKGAVKDLVNQLDENNTAAAPDNIRFSLISFNNIATTEVSSTFEASEINNRVDELTAGGGTNWEDALKTANEIGTRKDEGAETYVIFVSDGDPTFRNTKDGYGDTGEMKKHTDNASGKVYYGSGYSDNNGKNYDWALKQAESIVNAKKNFYGIGVFGNVDGMKKLVKDSKAPETNYYSATDQAGLEAAFANIINQITNAFGYKGVKITDGLTQMTSIDPNSFTYTRSGGSYGTGTNWEGAPAATYSDGQVSWDLGGLENGELEDGVTYTVSFTVWPSQAAYDLVSDLNNNIRNYDDLSEDEKAQIDVEGGDYGLKTNTAADVEYIQIETKTTKEEPAGYVPGGEAADGYTYTYDPETGVYTGTKETLGNSDIKNPPPMPLTDGLLTLEKKWTDDLDDSQRPDSIKLKVNRDGNKYMEVTLDEANNWSSQIHVAPGLKANDTVLETGHKYTVEEVTGSDSYELEMKPNTFHPMIVDGVLTPAGGAAKVTATNVLKSRVKVTKSVTAETGTAPDQLFTYKIKVNDKDGAVKFSINDSNGPVKFETSANRVSGAEAVMSDGKHTGYFSADSDKEITVKINKSEYIYIIDLSKEAAYEVEEDTSAMPDGFSFVKAESSAATIDRAKASGTVNEGNAEYAIAYTNKYEETSVSVKKIWDDGDDLYGKRPDSVKVSLYKQVGTGDKEEITDKEITLNANNNWQHSWNNLPKTSGGQDITYTVDEKKIPEGYNKSVNGDASAANSFTVTNKLNVGTLVIEKEIAGLSEGTTIPADTEFTVTGPGTDTTVNKTIKYSEFTDGKYELSNIPVGTYTVTENEASAAVSGYGLKVTKKGDGKVEAGKTATVKFKNTYRKGSANISVTKALDGWEKAGLKDKTFTFRLAAVTTNAPMPADCTVIATESARTQSFPAITYDAPGTYEYTVTEITSEGDKIPGVTYDQTAHKVEVKVSEDESTGQLSTSVKYDTDEDSLTVTNTYKAKSITAQIELNKSLTGRAKALGADEFSFTISKAAGTPDNTPMPEKTNVNNDADGKIDFGSIEYTSTGTYMYTVKENSGSVGGVVYDNREITVVVNVTDSGTGKLSTEVKYSGGDGDAHNTFTNTYIAEPTTLVLKAEKRLSNMKLKADQFKFKLVEVDEDGKDVDGVTEENIGNKGNGYVEFSPISYSAKGTHYYEITEVNGGKEINGIAYDDLVITVKVDVTDNNEGKLVAKATYPKDTTFNNEYNATGTQEIVGFKTLTGKELKAGDFAFEITAPEGTPMPEKTKVKNDAAGKVNFGKINIKLDDLKDPDDPDGGFLESKTFEYKVIESGGYPDVVNDTDQTFKITIRDNGEGRIDVTMNPATVPYFTFANKYKPLIPIPTNDSVTDTYTIKKELTGRDLAAEEFSFTMRDAEGKKVGTAKNNDTGDIIFPDIMFTEAGEYKYTIREDIGSLANVKYDKNVFNVKAIVTDPSNGSPMTIEWSSDDLKPGDTIFTFRNEFAYNNGYTDFPVIKQIRGDTPNKKATFTFKLEAVTTGAPMPEAAGGKSSMTATIVGSGETGFGLITYDKPGTYEYKITELNSGESGYKYDTSVYTAKCEVTESEDHVLSLKRTITSADGKEVDAAVFTNDYKADGSGVSTGDRNGLIGIFNVLLLSAIGIVWTMLRRREEL